MSKQSAAPRTIGDLHVMTVREVAERLSVPPIAIRALVKDGKLEAKRVATELLIPVSALAEFLSEGDEPGDWSVFEKGDRVVFFTPDEDDLRQGIVLAVEDDGQVRIETGGIFGLPTEVLADAEHVQALTISRPTDD